VLFVILTLLGSRSRKYKRADATFAQHLSQPIYQSCSTFEYYLIVVRIQVRVDPTHQLNYWMHRFALEACNVLVPLFAAVVISCLFLAAMRIIAALTLKFPFFIRLNDLWSFLLF